jgi:acetyl-CoA/propionyl-CoA carboxylase biotin carboxyl carrier protein
MFDSVLVANRGEIAVRVIRTLNRLGIRSVAVYSDADADAPHVAVADVAVRLGAAPAAESYLSIERVLAAAADTGAQAIHPGYGFLSENPEFARACARVGVLFIGPPPEATELLGDKAAAKDVAEAAGVPVLPGLSRPGLTDDEIVAFVQQDSTRLPVIVKAVAGGGGRGMRIVHDLGALSEALPAARREARAAFGEDSLLVERYVEPARHIEVQLLADSHGTILHLGERECSLQRRYQKIVEESPSPVVSEGLRADLGDAAVALAKAVGYVGAGTAEFLVSAVNPSDWFFMEVNARLQVEHPVTEEVTHLDLVEQQLLIASGRPLALSQGDVQLQGHSIEARVCAEDPGNGFLPVAGKLVLYHEPGGAGVRVDSGVGQGSTITPHYDSLLAKIIATGADREEALDRLDHALAEVRLLGVPTNAGYLRRLLAVGAVRAGELDTGLIERGEAAALPDAHELREALVAAAAAETLALGAAANGDPWDSLVGFRLDGAAPLDWELVPAGTEQAVVVRIEGPPARARALVTERSVEVEAHPLDAATTSITQDGRTRAWTLAADGADRWLAAGPDAFCFRLAEPVVEGASASADGSLAAPMPGTVLEVRVPVGTEVQEGQVLIVIESMKMELTLTAPADATVQKVHVTAGDGVKQGQVLVELGSAA